MTEPGPDAGEEERAPKRARKACLNCRRKKTRCSGETPVCAFCARLNQHCVWDLSREANMTFGSNYFNTPDAALAARVALLESKLNSLGADPASNLSTARPAGLARSDVGLDAGQGERQSAVAKNGHAEAVDFMPSAPLLPVKSVLAELIDTYFAHCHGRPYSYFHEPTFRQRVEEDAVPTSLLFALIATACRFSDRPEYSADRAQSIAAYSSASWARTFEQSFSYKHSLDITMVQTISMLAAIDFTSGYPRHGWIKVALSVRFAQALRLDEEPDAELPALEREERRRTFWSIYLLDRLISLGPDRPPTFFDQDCTVRLPSPHEAFMQGTDAIHGPTLEDILDRPTSSRCQDLDYFAWTVVMACTLGKFIRFRLVRASRTIHAPWDSRSAYYTIHSMLLHYESHSPLTYATLSELLDNQLDDDTFTNRPRAGHLVFTQALFHLNHCLLNHPFTLYNVFQRTSLPVPPSFTREALQRCRSHAAQLLDIIHEAQACGRLAETSFYGYCAMLSGITFRLYERHEDGSVASVATERVNAALLYLERRPVRWQFHPHMVRNR